MQVGSVIPVLELVGFRLQQENNHSKRQNNLCHIVKEAPFLLLLLATELQDKLIYNFLRYLRSLTDHKVKHIYSYNNIKEFLTSTFTNSKAITFIW